MKFLMKGGLELNLKISHLYPFGCVADAVNNHRDKNERGLGTKWSGKIELCIFVGYVLNSPNLYKLWSIKRRTAFHIPRQCVKFNEFKYPSSLSTVKELEVA